MRFKPHGPAVPRELLEERDNGNVVFFCGAGVSRPALPGFLQLARRVVLKLQPPGDARARTLLARAETDADFAPPLDEIFYLLQQEYGIGTIEDVVSQLLRTPANVNVEQHSVVLRLSSNAAGHPQVVTTNFDLLFERARKGLHKYMPTGPPRPREWPAVRRPRLFARPKGASADQWRNPTRPHSQQRRLWTRLSR